MDPSSSSSSSLNLELKIVRARNINLKSSAELFVRCYLCAGLSSKRVKLDSKEISSKSDLAWNQTFSLDCSGTKDTVESCLKKGTVIFELRRRISTPLLGRMSGSKLLARAELPWDDVVDTNNTEIEKWVVMIPKNGRVYDDTGDAIKPPAVQISAKIEEFGEIMERKKVNERRWDGCGCTDNNNNNGCKSCVDYEFFAIGAMLEAF